MRFAFLSSMPRVAAAVPRRSFRAPGTARPAIHMRTRLVVRAEVSADPKALKDTAALDQLIDLLLQSKSQRDLTQMVAENVLSMDQKFWIRIATRSDAATSREDKDRLSSLANTVMKIVDAMVRKAEGQMSDSAAVLQDILKSAADENGEWTLPLPAAKAEAMRAMMDKHADSVNEALLATVYAYLKKASDDRMDGVIALLQKLLQIYASRELGQTGGPVGEILAADESRWEAMIQEKAASGALSEAQFSETVQKLMEATVLKQQSGSYAQRVQAEYLKELEERGRAVFKKA